MSMPLDEPIFARCSIRSIITRDAFSVARICYATLRDDHPYGAARLQHKLTRTAFALPA